MERLITWLAAIGLLLAAYLLGSIPFGLIIVRLTTGKDVRKVESGRTGGTNVMRAAGFGAGLATALLDMLKGAAAVWLVRLAAPGNPWLEVLAPVLAVLGHNFSIFLLERNERGNLRLRGGAGGATTVGGAFGLWMPSLAIILPVGIFFLYVIGYASLATLSVGLAAIAIFAVRAYLGANPWEFTLYGVLVLLILAYALRPNIQRLIQGNERLVGLRARKKHVTESITPGPR